MDILPFLKGVSDLADPAKTLIEQVFKALEGCFKPWQIQRIAEAEKKAVIIQTQGEIEAYELRERAVSRLINQETIRQLNLESILNKALPHVNSDAKPELLTSDWINYWFDKCKDISGEDMKELWARILAQEANKRDSISKITISTLSIISSKEACNFTNLLSFSVVINDDKQRDFIVNSYTDLNEKFGIMSLNELFDLETLGLIQYSKALEGESLTYEPNVDNEYIIEYFDNKIIIKNYEHGLNIGKILLTKIGHELTSICEIKPVNEYFEYLQEQFSKENYTIEVKRK